MRFRIFLIVFFLGGIYLFFLGDSGFLRRISLSKKVVQAEKRISVLEKNNQKIEEKIRAYRNQKFSTEDLLASGYIANDEKVLINPNEQGNYVKIAEEEKNFLRQKQLASEEIFKIGNSFKIKLEHLRILWIVFSVFFVLWYLNKKRHLFSKSSSSE